MKLTWWMAFGSLLTGLFLLTSCLGDGEIKIGVIIPQEGSSLQEYGNQITFGIKLAMEDLKAENKLRKKYKLIIKNEDQHDMESVKRAFQELKKEGVIAVIGAASSAATLELAPLANKTRTVLLSPAASTPELSNDKIDFVFRNQPSDTLEAQLLSNVIFQKCRIQKVLMVRSRSAYGEGITLDLLKFGRQNPNKIPGEVIKFEETGQVDFVAVVDRIIDHAPQAVFLAGYTSELIPLIREIKTRPELEEVYIFTSSSFLPEKMINGLGIEALEGLMYTSYQWDPNKNIPEIQRFSQRFEEEFFTKPDIYAANGYDALIVLVRAIDRTNHRVRDAIRDELNKIILKPEHTKKPLEEGEEEDPQIDSLILRDTDFNKRGDVTRIPHIYRIQNGISIRLTPEEMEEIKRKVLAEM